MAGLVLEGGFDGRSWAPPLVGGRRRTGRVVAAATALLLAAALAAAGWAAWEVRAYAASYDGLMLPGTTIGGVDVSGMDREQALAAVGALVAPELDRSVALRLDAQTWETTPRALGATSDVEGAVDGALRAGAAASPSQLIDLRFRGGGLGYHGEVTVDHAAVEAGARALVAGVAAELDATPTDATMTYDDHGITFTAEQYGLSVAEGATADALVAALSGGAGQDAATAAAEVEVQAVRFAPATTLADLGQVLYLDQSENHLWLYDRGEAVQDWTVTTGTSGYPTPLGEYEVELKRFEPTWVNPSPDGWGSNMPASIGPGPYNPLGLRALNWGGTDAIRFHGTENVDALGSPGSHGCVRLANAEVIELYDLVDVGAKIISVA